MRTIEFRCRAVGQPANWQDLPVYATFDVDLSDAVNVQCAICAVVADYERSHGVHVEEVRYNIAGVLQGHYVNIAPLEGL